MASIASTIATSFAAVGQVGDEGAVDLQEIDTGHLQIRQRRITRTEVVDRNADAQRMQCVDRLLGGLAQAQNRAFGDFEQQIAWVISG
jgi:hypothetical protein